MASTDYALRLITAPTVEPVTLTEAKAHCIVEHTSDDTIITGFIAAARRHIEWRINRPIMRQKWRLYLDQFCDPIDLLKRPVISIDAVNYIDSDGVTQVLGGATSPINPSAYYSLDVANGFMRKAYGANYPTPRAQPQAVWVDFWAGLADTSTSPQGRAPEDIRSAVLLLTGHLYEHRESQSDLQLYENSTLDLLIQAHWMPV
jgi:uncharacterized phiE125 gp8 family phage protein